MDSTTELQPDIRPLQVGDRIAYKTVNDGTLKGKITEVFPKAGMDGIARTGGYVVWRITSKLPRGHMYKRGQVMSSHTGNPFLWRR